METAASLDIAEATATGEITGVVSDLAILAPRAEGTASPSNLRGSKGDDNSLLSKVQPTAVGDPGEMLVGDTLEGMSRELVFTRIIRACCGQVLGLDGVPIGPGAADRARR